jgi:hypothetical protein
MSARAWDLGLGLAFALLGVLLAVAGTRLPPGIAGVPGPGVFPMAIGAILVALGLALAWTRTPAGATYWERGWRAAPTRQVAAILVLLAVYVALWDVVPFIWRTPALLVGIYLVVGEPWLRSLAVAVVTTAALAGVFAGLLRVRL